MDQVVIETIQRVINAPTDIDSILQGVGTDIRDEVIHQFLTNLRLRSLFPELVSLVSRVA
jgi:hypothetical protein